MAISALKFIGLTAAAVVLGVFSAAVTVGQLGPDISGTDSVVSGAVEARAANEISGSETMRTLRHIIGR